MRDVLSVGISMLVITALLSCTRTIYVPVEQRRSETVVWHDTIIAVERVPEVMCNHTIDTISTLHSQVASSTAIISDGVLSHRLTVHPRQDSVVVKWREVYITDSIPYPIPMADNTSNVWRWGGYMWLILVGALLLIVVAMCIFRVHFKR